MKNFVALVIVSMISLSSFAQSTFQVASKNTLHGSIQTQDGGFISAGIGVDGVFLLKLNAKAQTVWTKNVNAPSIELLNIINTTDGGFALCVGMTVNDSNRVGLYKFDANAKLLWAKSYKEGNGGATYVDGNAGAVLQASDGGYMIVCTVRGGLQNALNASAGYLIKTDASGNVVWSKKYFSYAENEMDNIKQTSDGNYVFTAYTADLNETSDSAFVVKINASGAILWSKYYTENDYSGNDPYSVTPLSDGGVIITHLAAGQFLVINKLDASGNSLWSKANLTNSANAGYNFDYFSYGDLVETPDQSYVYAGNVNSITGDSILYDIIKFSHTGVFQWEKQFANGKFNLVSNGFSNIIHTADNGYLGTGLAQTEDNGMFTAETGMIFKFDSNFNSCNVPTTIKTSSWVDGGVFYTKNVLTNSATTLALNVVPIIANSSTVNVVCSDIKSLPVGLISFTASLTKDDAKLQWQTATEINSGYFKVERSGNGQDFKEIGTVKASGSSNVVQNYSYDDAGAANLGVSNLYYRLKELDEDGAVNYSKIIDLTLNPAAWVIKLTPNPVSEVINISSSLDVSETSITVTDITGRVLSRFKQNLSAGKQIQIPAAHLAAGVYIVSIETKTERKTFKVVKR